MKSLRTSLSLASVLGLAVLFNACGTQSINAVPFAPEKTRIMIAATPEEVTTVLGQDFVNRFREEHMKRSGMGGPAHLESSAKIVPPDMIRVKFGPAETQRGDSFDFYFQKVQGGISLVGDGYAMVTGTVQNPGPVMKVQYRPSDNEEALVKGIMLEIKAKAEALHAKNGSNN